MGALTPIVFKEGFLTTPCAECRGCPGTHTFKEGLSLSVHHECPGTHAKRDSPILYICGKTGTIFFKKKNQFIFIFRYSIWQYSCVGTVFLLEHRTTSVWKGQKCMCISVCVCVCVLILIQCPFHPHESITISPQTQYRHRLRVFKLAQRRFDDSSDVGFSFDWKVHTTWQSRHWD